LPKATVTNLTDFEKQIYSHFGRFNRTKTVKKSTDRPYIPNGRSLAEWDVISRIVDQSSVNELGEEADCGVSCELKRPVRRKSAAAIEYSVSEQNEDGELESTGTRKSLRRNAKKLKSPSTPTLEKAVTRISKGGSPTEITCSGPEEKAAEVTDNLNCQYEFALVEYQEDNLNDIAGRAIKSPECMKEAKSPSNHGAKKKPCITIPAKNTTHLAETKSNGPNNDTLLLEATIAFKPKRKYVRKSLVDNANAVVSQPAMASTPKRKYVRKSQVDNTNAVVSEPAMTPKPKRKYVRKSQVDNANALVTEPAMASQSKRKYVRKSQVDTANAVVSEPAIESKPKRKYIRKSQVDIANAVLSEATVKPKRKYVRKSQVASAGTVAGQPNVAIKRPKTNPLSPKITPSSVANEHHEPTILKRSQRKRKLTELFEQSSFNILRQKRLHVEYPIALEFMKVEKEDSVSQRRGERTIKK